MKATLIFLVFMCSAFPAFCQKSVFFTGIFPEVSVTKRLHNEDRINFKVENQQVVFGNRNTDFEKFKLVHYRTDLMFFYDWRVSPSKSISLGLFHRFQEGSDANRFIQQFSTRQRLRNLRMTHRLRTDQTFIESESIEVRFRYRLGLEIPLKGTTLDPNEPYLLISNEPILSYKDSDFELENRFVFSLGHLFQNGQRLEWSVDYRTDGFVEKPFRTRLWAKVGYFLSF